MTTYRYLLCDLLTDTPLVDLPLTGVTFEKRISRVGPLQATLHATNPKLVERARIAHAYAGRSALWVFRDGQVWWGGVLWTARATQAERGGVTLALAGATFDSYAHHRTLRATLNYVQTDQGLIIPRLWQHLQADPRGHIGMAAEDQPTGVLRDRAYYDHEHHKYGELIEALGDVEGGPEHTVDTYLDETDTRTKRLRVANRLGATTPSIVFQRAARGGGRVLEWDDTADAVDGGTTFQTRGDAAEGNVGEEQTPLLSAVHEAHELLDAGWPLLDVTEDRPGVTELATLDGHAMALRDARAGQVQTKGYRVQVGDTGWTPNRLGDPVRIRLRDLWHTETTDDTVRPVGCKVTAAEKGTPETIELLI